MHLVNRMLLLVCFIAGMGSCNTPHKETVVSKQTLRDSVFSPLRECVAKSSDVKMILNPARIKIADENETENSRIPDEQVLLADKVQIEDLIRNFPAIFSGPDTLEFVRVSGHNNIYFTCNGDTLIDCSWDAGEHQICINGMYFKIDFTHLHSSIDPLLRSTKHH